MTDVLFVAIAVTFLGLCVLYVRWIDRTVTGIDQPGLEREESR